jgi:hypothetical protein
MLRVNGPPRRVAPPGCPRTIPSIPCRLDHVVTLAPAEQVLPIVGATAMKREHMVELSVRVPEEDVFLGVAVRAERLPTGDPLPHPLEGTPAQALHTPRR